MAVEVEQFGDVTRLRMSSAGSRVVGMSVSAYVVRGVMIDTGFPHARAELLAAAERAAVRRAIVTHWHEDHAGNAQALTARGIAVSARADTERVLQERPPIRFYRKLLWGWPPALVDRLETSDESAASLEGIHTPGHSPDHQVVWDSQTGTLFSGDLWLGVRARAVHATEDPYLIVDSLRIVATLDPARMFDAHRGLVDRPPRAIAAKIDWLSETLDAIERALAAGESDRSILRRLLGGEEASAYVSGGEYARRNLIKAVRRHMGPVLPVHGQR